MCACVIYDICLRVATPKGIIHPLTLVFHVDLSILSGESEAHATPEILSRVCSGASAATGCRDTTPRIATTVASAPVPSPELAHKPSHTSFFNPSLPLSIHEVSHQASTQRICLTMPAACTLRDHHFPPVLFPCHGHQGP